MHGKKQTSFTFLSTEKVFSLSTFLTSTYFSVSCLLHLLFHCFDRTRNGWSTVTPTIVKNSRNIQQNPVNFPTKPSRSSILLYYRSGSHRSIYDSQSKTSERSSTDRKSCEPDPNRQMRLVLRKGPNFNTHSCPFAIAGLAFVTKYLWARFVVLIFHFLVETSVHFFPRAYFTLSLWRHLEKMPFRDKEGRYCGTLHRKEVDNHWTRNYFILDEEKCLLRYFSPMEASVRKSFVCFPYSNSCVHTRSFDIC